MIVVDASAAVLGLLTDGAARAALASRPLAAPHLVDSEVAHAQRVRVRRGELDAAGGERALKTWARLGIERFPTVGLLDRIWELRANLTAYEAGYVALAEALDRPLLTADGRLGRAAGPTCTISVVRS